MEAVNGLLQVYPETTRIERVQAAVAGRSESALPAASQAPAELNPSSRFPRRTRLTKRVDFSRNPGGPSRVALLATMRDQQGETKQTSLTEPTCCKWRLEPRPLLFSQ